MLRRIVSSSWSIDRTLQLWYEGLWVVEAFICNNYFFFWLKSLSISHSGNPVLRNITDYLIEEASAEEEELLGSNEESSKQETEEKSEGETIQRDLGLIKVSLHIFICGKPPENGEWGWALYYLC